MASFYLSFYVERLSCKFLLSWLESITTRSRLSLKVVFFFPREQLYLLINNSFVFILQADADKDGRLTLTEMIDHPYVFYSAIFNEDDEDDYDFHDEFR